MVFDPEKLEYRDGEYVCPLCGITSKNKFKHNCKKESKAEPTSIKKVFNFAEALAKHIADGMQKRSKEEIEQLLKICKNCPGGYYNKEKSVCNVCGCPVTASKTFFNKLAFRSEHCPKDYW